MRIATWNVNGIRARQGEVSQWLELEKPDVLCLQEIKAAEEQVPREIFDREDYWCRWHGQKGYSGVALLVSRALCPEPPEFSIPPFDFETRILTAAVGDLSVSSVYVPNGGKDFAAKMRFLADLEAWAADRVAAERQVLLCGDLNITRTEKDVHPKERSRKAVGQLPEEREVLEGLLARGLVDVARRLDPDNDLLFTWWPPWRNLRQKNVGWRIDYILASEPLASKARECRSLREFGTSDHAPVVLDLDESPTGDRPGSPPS